MATGRAIKKITVYFGPGETVYPSQGSYVGPNETVTILWKEGNWYYIEYRVGSTSRLKRMYIPAAALSKISGNVTEKTLWGKAKTSTTATTYTGPGTNYSVAGWVGPETVLCFNEMSRGFTFIEYNVSGGLKKRGYIPSGKLSDPGSQKILTDPVSPTRNYSYREHNDIPVTKGTPVYAMCDGTLVVSYIWGKKYSQSVDSYVSYGIKASLTPDAGWKSADGKTVSTIIYGHLESVNGFSFPKIETNIKASDIGHPGKLYEGGSNYGYDQVHSKYTVLKGSKKVKVGQEIGRSGNTGNTTGPHLHIGLV